MPSNPWTFNRCRVVAETWSFISIAPGLRPKSILTCLLKCYITKAMLHLITGLPCAGKTTYSLKLKADTAGVHLSLDHWLITSFGQYSIDEIGHDEHLGRVIACRKLIQEVAAELLQRSVDVILDDGFFLREDRVRYSDFAASFGAQTKTHFLDTPKDIIRLRVAQRNATLPQFNFKISPAMLEWFFDVFEKPSAAEGPELVVVVEKLTAS